MIISILILLILISLFAISPLVLLGCGKLFKVRNISFKNAFLAGLIIFIIGVMFQLLIQLLILAFHIDNIWIDSFFGLFSFAIAVWVVKTRFKTNTLRAFGIYFTSIILAVVLSVPIAFSIRAFAVQAFKLPSGAMLNTILIGDHILVNKLIYKFKSPMRGDIIVFKYPKDPNIYYIKRIVGLSGDTIEIKNKQVFINNALIEEKYIIHSDGRMLSSDISPRDNFGPITIPDNSFFVMGDNRDNSYDSRFWGFVNLTEIKGKAFIIYWSLNPDNGTERLERVGMTL